MSYLIRLHPFIQHDYSEGYAWYEDRQKGLGERFLKAVRLKLHEIQQQPEAFGSRNNKRFREARVDFFPYIIVYRVYKSKKEIFISSIHHHKKHPKGKYRK